MATFINGVLKSHSDIVLFSPNLGLLSYSQINLGKYVTSLTYSYGVVKEKIYSLRRTPIGNNYSKYNGEGSIVMYKELSDFLCSIQNVNSLSEIQPITLFIIDGVDRSIIDISRLIVQLSTNSFQPINSSFEKLLSPGTSTIDLVIPSIERIDNLEFQPSNISSNNDSSFKTSEVPIIFEQVVKIF